MNNNVHPIASFVATNDWFWQTRGHYAIHGTGTICDFVTGGVIDRQHLSKTSAVGSVIVAYKDTAKSMDAYGFELMLKRMVDWMEEEVPEIVRECGLGVLPRFDGVVLDGDSSTDRHVERVAARAEFCATSKVCGGLRVRPCVNHLAKNIGKKFAEFGAQLHRTCSCPVLHTQAGVPYKDGRRNHVGCPNMQHPIVKVAQRCMGAAMRGAAAMEKRLGESVADAGVGAVEECLLHL